MAMSLSLSFDPFAEYLHGYEEFQQYIRGVEPNSKTYFYFSGTKDDSGKSWCSDCEAAEPYVFSAIEKYAEGCTVVSVDVGNRIEWKDTQNSFRLDPSLRLEVIPTLVLWGTVKKLHGALLEKLDVMEMMFTQDDDN